MKTSIIIPARYGSSRFPGKPLARIFGEPMILWVWVAAIGAAKLNEDIDNIVVATDSEEIISCCKRFNINAELTDLRHTTGTSRCMEICENHGWDKDYERQILIFQGDEPMVTSSFLAEMSRAHERGHPLATGYCNISDDDEFDHNVVKVLLDKGGRSIYFSRRYMCESYRHIGIYLYRMPLLRAVMSTLPGPLERAENLEQLRAVEIGEKFYMVKWNSIHHPRPISVDVPGDIHRVEAAIKYYITS